MAILFKGTDFATEYPEYAVEYGDTILLRIGSDYYRAVMSEEKSPAFLKSPAEHLCLGQKMNFSFIYDKSKVVIVEIYKKDIKSQYEELKKFFETVVDMFYKNEYDETEAEKENPQYKNYDEFRNFCFTEYFEIYNHDEGLFDEDEYRLLRRLFNLYYAVKTEYLIKYGVNMQWFVDEFNCSECGKENTMTYLGAFFHEKNEQFLTFICNKLPDEDVEYKKVIRAESDIAVEKSSPDETSSEAPHKSVGEEMEAVVQPKQDMIDVINAPYQLKKHATECPYCNKKLVTRECIVVNNKLQCYVELLYCGNCECYYTNNTTVYINKGIAKPKFANSNITNRYCMTNLVKLPDIPKEVIIYNNLRGRIKSFSYIEKNENIEVKYNRGYQQLSYDMNVKINNEDVQLPYSITAQNLQSIEVIKYYKVNFYGEYGGINVYTVNEASGEKTSDLSTVERDSKLYIEENDEYARKSGRIVENVMVNGKTVNLPYVHVVDGIVNISATYTTIKETTPVFRKEDTSISVNITPHLKLTSDKIKVYRNGIPVKSGSILQPGELLSVQCVNNARLKILYNGSLIRTPHVITVGNSDVVLELVENNENTAVKVRFSDKESGAVHDDLQLNASSFLGDLGYSTSLSTSERYEILQKAVKMYGKAKVINFLEYLIRGKVAQINGAAKYQNAISIWRFDINRVSNM